MKLAEIAKLSRPPLATAVISKFKKLGYNYVTLDLEGYRSGGLNEVLKTEGAVDKGRFYPKRIGGTF